MEHAAFVRGSEPRADFSGELDRLVLREPSDSPQQRGQVLAVEILHRQEVHAFDEADVVDAAHVGM